jgi:hypothetical protein
MNNSLPACNIEVTELEIDEHIVCSAKLSGLSAETREHIQRVYGSGVSDIAYAEEAAARIMQTYAVPPRWAYEVAGPQPGWHRVNRLGGGW